MTVLLTMSLNLHFNLQVKMLKRKSRCEMGLLNTLQALRLNEEKIRIVLNKADMIDTDQMMRVHGSLMWSLGRVFETPEVVRVYIRRVLEYFPISF